MSYVAFQADDSHRRAIARLWADNMGDRRISAALEQRLRWLYSDPRAGHVRTWLVEEAETHEIVGCASVCPRILYVDGRELRAGLLADFVIAKAHRVAGPAILLQRKIASDCEASGLDIVFGHPNHGAVPIFRRVGYRQVGSITTWSKPLRSERRLRLYLHPMLASLASFAADALLSANDLRLLTARGRRFHEEVLDRADYRFDDLWNRAKDDLPAGVQRSSQYLNWRYADFTTTPHRLFAITDHRGARRLRGYVAWRSDNGVAFVTDIFWQGGRRVLESLLIRFSSRMRRDGLDSIHLIFLGGDTMNASLRALQFVPASRDDRPLIAYVGNSPSEQLRSLVADPRKWLLFDGDLDL